MLQQFFDEISSHSTMIEEFRGFIQCYSDLPNYINTLRDEYPNYDRTLLGRCLISVSFLLSRLQRMLCILEEENKLFYEVLHAQLCQNNLNRLFAKLIQKREWRLVFSCDFDEMVRYSLLDFCKHSTSIKTHADILSEYRRNLVELFNEATALGRISVIDTPETVMQAKTLLFNSRQVHDKTKSELSDQIALRDILTTMLSSLKRG